MDSKEHLLTSCDASSTKTIEIQWVPNVSIPKIKKERVESSDEEELPLSVYKHRCEPLESTEYINHYDCKDYVLKQVKKEFPEEEYPQAGCSLNSNVVEEDKELLKPIDRQQVKVENTEEGVFINIKQEHDDKIYEIPIKKEKLEEQELLDNNGDTDAQYDSLLVPREIQKILDARKLKKPPIMPKSHADRQREYRMRKKLEKQQLCPKKIPMTNAEHQRKFRQNQKNLQHNEKLVLAREATVKSCIQCPKEYGKRKLESANKTPKTNAQRQRQFRRKQKKRQKTEPLDSNLPRRRYDAERSKRYRDRMKLNKQRVELDSLLSSKEYPLSTVLVNDNKEIDRCHSTQCKGLILSPFYGDDQQINRKSLKVLYEEHDECSVPNVLLHHETNIANDGNCLFSSLIRVLNLEISTATLRCQLYASVQMKFCQNPRNAKRILSSELEYGDLDCLLIFTRTYNKNVCVHFHHLNNEMREVVCFGHFKVNNSANYLHLHLRGRYFTPYIVVQKILHRKGMDFQGDDSLSHKSTDGIYIEQTTPLRFDNEVEVETSDTKSANYTAYYKHTHAHLEFHRHFENNTFGHSCAVCDRLCWKSDLKQILYVDRKLLQTIVPDYRSGTEILVCPTCKVCLEKNKIPLLSTFNGFKYPPIPSHLPPLNLIEQRLISPRIAFMQIRRHIQRQNGVRGQIINVPVEIDTMVKKLPRSIADDHSLYVHIKKKIIHKTSYVHGLINKNNVNEWLNYLVQTPLYMHNGIQIDDAFLNNDQPLPKLEIDDISEYVPIEDDLTEQQQTLVWNEDKMSHIVHNEQNTPSILFDEYAEELSFPTIYGGHFRSYRDDITVTPFMQATSELRRTDRRGADPQHLLYVAAKIMRARVNENVNVALKLFAYNTIISKEQMISERYVNNSLETNLAFLQYIPNSASYWAESKENLFAMIRQLGLPTAFMMLSANEVGWTNLVQLLYKLRNNGLDMPEELISRMDSADKAKLVNEDSVTCAIYFNRFVDFVLKLLQYKKNSPFGKYRVIHYHRRIEFQRNGSPEAHILLWLDNVPKDLLGNEKEVIKMIDDLVSVSEVEASGNIKLQTHKHNSNCYNENDKCRFGAPFMPSRNTITLLPIRDTDTEYSERNLEEYKQHYESIRMNLANFEYKDFRHFYTHNNIASDKHYYDIIRAGINRPTLLYRRKPSEIWNNTFNPFILHHMKSSMELRIIQDEYTCADHVIEYVRRHNKGIGDLRRLIVQLIDENPGISVIDITKRISIDVLHSVEMSTQEAAWYLLRESTVKASENTIYIPTINPSERQRIRKSYKELNELDDDCTDVWKENWFDRYEKRPEELNNVTLAQYVAKYYMQKKGLYVERNAPKIIRYRNYDEADNFNDHRREMVLLHIPFRNEDNDILADDKFIELYESNKELIAERRKEFELNSDMQKTLEICRQLCIEHDGNDGEMETRIP